MLMVLRQTSLLVLTGLVVGLPAWLIASRSAASLLYGLAPYDATTVVAAAGLLAVIAVAASVGPAWRAARIDPIRALREE
jgi:ABC-type antimicrobial peptide transport system permease subunit